MNAEYSVKIIDLEIAHCYKYQRGKYLYNQLFCRVNSKDIIFNPKKKQDNYARHSEADQVGIQDVFGMRP